MRVLVVEDDGDQRRLLALVARAHGHEVVECATVADARRAPPCDLALVDRRLPDGDGAELARSLGGRAFVLTGDDEPLDLPVLLKPVRPADLERVLGTP